MKFARALLVTTLTLASLIVAGGIARADLPGQPNGIPASAWSNQWRPNVGNLCAEDLTGNYDGKTSLAIARAALEVSHSSDWNVTAGVGATCEANGYGLNTRVTFVMNHTDPDGDNGVHKPTVLVTTEGGFRVGGYVTTRAIVHVFSGDVDWFSHQGATDRLMLMELVRVLSFRDPAGSTSPGNRTDTVLYTGVQRVQLTGWDYDRLAAIAPWGV